MFIVLLDIAHFFVRPRESDTYHQCDKLKFIFRSSESSGGAVIRRMQYVTHWLSAQADKLKFEVLCFPVSA